MGISKKAGFCIEEHKNAQEVYSDSVTVGG